jgi:hypothetical protein
VLCSFAAVGAGRNVAAALLAEDAGLAAIQAVAFLLATLGAVGVATPVVLALLAVSLNPILDNLSYSSSLPSMVLAMCLVALAVAPAGRTRSVDAVLLRRSGLGERALRRLLRLVGTADGGAGGTRPVLGIRRVRRRQPVFGPGSPSRARLDIRLDDRLGHARPDDQPILF